MEQTFDQPALGAAQGASDALPADLLLLNADQVAKMLGMGRTKVYEMIAAEELPVITIGTSKRVPRDRLLRWIERNTRERIN